MTSSNLALSSVETVKRQRAKVVSYAEQASDSEDSSEDESESDAEHQPGVEVDDSSSDGDSSYGEDMADYDRAKTPKPAQIPPPISPPVPPTVKPWQPLGPFPLFKLAPELRAWIFELALTDPSGRVCLVNKSRNRNIRRAVVRVAGPLPDFGYHAHHRLFAHSTLHATSSRLKNEEGKITPVPKLNVSLLCSCQQIYFEAINLLYRAQIFEVCDTMALHSFLANIGSTNRTRLSSIRFKRWGMPDRAQETYNYTSMTLLATCRSLRLLDVDCIVADGTSTPQRLAQQFYLSAFVFFEGFASNNPKRDTGLEILRLGEWDYDVRRAQGNSIGRERPPSSLLPSDEYEAEFKAETRRLMKQSLSAAFVKN